MATNNNAKIKKNYVLLFKTPKDDYIKDPYVEVCDTKDPYVQVSVTVRCFVWRLCCEDCSAVERPVRTRGVKRLD